MAVTELESIVIVGSSLAGLRAAETLRTDGLTGRITMIGAESHRPYDRSPLSKKLLAGEWEPERIALRKPEDLDGLNLDWRLGSAATGLDTDKLQVLLANGEAVSYDGLIIATGCLPRYLPGQPAWAGIHTLRTLDDSQRRLSFGVFSGHVDSACQCLTVCSAATNSTNGSLSG